MDLQQHRNRVKARIKAHNEYLGAYNEAVRFSKSEKERKALKITFEENIDRMDAEEAKQIKEMQADPELAPFCCDLEFSFQARRKYEDNYEVDELLRNEFPQGVCDSEMGEGHFFIARQFKEAVKVFLRPKATSISIIKNDGLIISEEKGEKEYRARLEALNYEI